MVIGIFVWLGHFVLSDADKIKFHVVKIKYTFVWCYEQYLSIFLKVAISSFTIAAVVAMSVHFSYHNNNCIDYAYSKFAIAEYVTVARIVSFHATATNELQFSPDKCVVHLEG